MMMVKNGYRPSIQSDVPKCYKDLIESCWSNDPEQRPTFDEIVENLKNNPDFITNTVDHNEFYDYVDYIDSIISPKKESKNHVFHKISIDYEAKEESYDNDPNIKKYFLDLSLFEKVKKINNGPNWKLYQMI